jgi:hypothetical protein
VKNDSPRFMNRKAFSPLIALISSRLITSRVSAVIKISEASGASEYASEMLTLS